MDDIAVLDAFMREFETQETVAADAWPSTVFMPDDLGLIVDAQQLRWPSPPDFLQHEQIARQLDLSELKIFRVVGSTNTELVNLAASQPIADVLYLAEFQAGGRGRRGRAWLSPYARNLAVSLGFSCQRKIAELGGLSSVIGLAIVSFLEAEEFHGAQLKWPNDVLIDDKKLSGILVELVQKPGAVDVVIGIGVNVSLSDEEIRLIGQPATDLRSLGIAANRTQLVVRLVSYVRRFLGRFDSFGFAPFIEAFNTVHKYHQQTCAVMQGEQTVEGVVLGVGVQGELRLQTANGEQSFHGGEVSLRSSV